MKKIMTSLGLVLAVGAVTLGATACGPTGGGETPTVEKTIEVLVQTADHGWTGAVQSYAKEKVDALNKEGKYKVNLTACKDAKVEKERVADLLTKPEALHGIVLLPIDATMEKSVGEIATANVPFVQFDRVISNDLIDNAKSRVANVLGDNYGIGVETAKAFIKKGIKPGEKVLIMPGDQSSVPVSRTKGFKDTLVKEGGWSQAQVDAIEQTKYTGWSRKVAREIFVSKAESITEYPWIFTHDSEIAMGILEELKSDSTPATVKEHFKNGGVKALASSSGLDEMYAVLENDHKYDYIDLLSKDTYLFDVTYDPAMIQTAIQDMVDCLDGNAPKEKNHVIEVKVVDKDNVKQFKGFGGGNYRK